MEIRPPPSKKKAHSYDFRTHIKNAKSSALLGGSVRVLKKNPVSRKTRRNPYGNVTPELSAGRIILIGCSKTFAQRC